MAKTRSSDGTGMVGDDAPPVETPTPGEPKGRREFCDVVCRKSFKIGAREVPVGAKLAEIEFAPGVDLNILVDAVRNERAGRKKDGPQK